MVVILDELIVGWCWFSAGLVTLATTM